ncbi:SDR family oxidoreductase [Chitinophaga pinensis]|uniref:Short-chain dehydrogenase/reductase SDR n=1 Tax=Chitinophaga pinensis (strain ATCC 43595 / DSM 2588 / LMG 13176 / NBRC 15968 / NCIMB 11800 / UQM 2034) TaxID=485918 RepID=A0A979GRQ2_CHIPD|nr:SDR family oxidoreductase [Chitinophaga pinensis]ACU58611.1 short-chain dehydrogenase/reductase SDR [Chitinophaga pinensis DSM 2588]
MKTIFITGTSSGLGKAAVQLFHHHGWNVIATMRNAGKGDDFSELERVTVLPLDITDPEQIRSTVAAAIALGPVDVVLNNAAYGAMGPLEGFEDEDISKQVDTNLLGAIRITHAFIPHFREQKSGMFINITSIAGLVTFPFASLYHAVKWGLEAFSEGMTYELAPWGISVKTVAPGFIRTAFGANAKQTTAAPYETALEQYMKVVTGMMDPTKSGSTAEEIAAVVYEAVTDGKDQVHYTAGADSTSMYERRLEVGAEASRREMSTIFLG